MTILIIKLLSTAEPDCSRCNYTTGQIWLPDSLDCQKYYICVKIFKSDNSSYWDNFHVACANTLYWDQSKLTCTDEIPDDCIVQGTALPPATTDPSVTKAGKTTRTVDDAKQHASNRTLCHCHSRMLVQNASRNGVYIITALLGPSTRLNLSASHDSVAKMKLIVSTIL